MFAASIQILSHIPFPYIPYLMALFSFLPSASFLSATVYNLMFLLHYQTWAVITRIKVSNILFALQGNTVSISNHTPHFSIRQYHSPRQSFYIRLCLEILHKCILSLSFEVILYLTHSVSGNVIHL